MNICQSLKFYLIWKFCIVSVNLENKQNKSYGLSLWTLEQILIILLCQFVYSLLLTLSGWWACHWLAVLFILVLVVVNPMWCLPSCGLVSCLMQCLVIALVIACEVWYCIVMYVICWHIHLCLHYFIPMHTLVCNCSSWSLIIVSLVFTSVFS